MSIFKLSVITRKQCIPRIAHAQHAKYVQEFSRLEGLHALYVNLDVSCTVHRRLADLHIRDLPI